MRFDAATLLLGLAALGSLPAGSARVLYGYQPSEDLVDATNNATKIDRRAVVPVLKPAPKPVPKPVEPVAPAPEPIIPGGDKTPTTPGGEKAPDSEPAPLVPADKDPAAPATDKDGKPLTPADKDPAAPADKDKDGATTSDKDVMDDMDLWCDSAQIAAKRWLEARAGSRGRQQCRSRSRERSDSELRTYYSERARTGERYIRERPRDDNVEFDRRRRERYTTDREESPEAGIEDWLERTNYGERYGFYRNYVDEVNGQGGWSTTSTYSNGNRGYPVSRVSFARSQRNPDHVGVMAHERFVRRDSNRYQVDNLGNTREDSRGNYIDADGYRDNAVPVSNHVARGAVDAGMFNPPPRRISFMSDNIVNPDGRRLINDAFDNTDLPRDRDHMLLRRDSAGLEREHYDRISSFDNNYSYMNSAVRNPEYDPYTPRDIDVYRRGGYDTSYNWDRD